MPHTKPRYEVAENIGLFYSLVYHLRARSPVNHHIDSGIMFAIVLIKEINSLFTMGIFNKENSIIIDGSVSRLMFCCHSMIYTALNLNNSVGTPQATGGMNQKSLQAETLLKRSH